jgi:hypothetical protein
MVRPSRIISPVWLLGISAAVLVAWNTRKTSRGELIKAAYLDPQPQPVNDAGERFKKELDFWKHWQSEKLKSVQPLEFSCQLEDQDRLADRDEQLAAISETGPLGF